MISNLCHALLLLLSSANLLSSTAFSASNQLLQKMGSTQASLQVEIGRIPGTAMPEEWCASGAKLAFALELEFTTEPAEYGSTKERLLQDAMMGGTLLAVEPLNEPSFVGANGTQIINMQPGAYGCQIQHIESKQFALRYYLDCGGAKRNDVELPAERIYFLSSCWLSPDDSNLLEPAQKRKEQLINDIDLIDARMNKIRSSDKSDNILGNVVQAAFNFRHLVTLVERKSKLKEQLDVLEQTYPVDSTKIIQGPNGVIYARDGVIAVKRLRGMAGTREQYHWIGTFSINDFFEDD